MRIDEPTAVIVAAFISAIVGGSLVAGLNYYFSRRLANQQFERMKKEKKKERKLELIELLGASDSSEFLSVAMKSHSKETDIEENRAYASGWLRARAQKANQGE